MEGVAIFGVGDKFGPPTRRVKEQAESERLDSTERPHRNIRWLTEAGTISLVDKSPRAHIEV